MSLKNDAELTNTQAKLARAEVRYQALRDEAGGDEELREATMEGLGRFINQLKEEITRYQIRQRSQGNGETRRVGLRDDCELANTREKLRLLEQRYEDLRSNAAGDEHLRELSMHSLKRLMNQLKEDIARYETHQPAPQ